MRTAKRPFFALALTVLVMALAFSPLASGLLCGFDLLWSLLITSVLLAFWLLLGA